MRTLTYFILATLCSQSFAGGTTLYGKFFSEKTMRVDYFHTGTKGEERLSLDQVYEEGPWPGSRVNLIDSLNLGEYIVRVFDHATSVLIYSRGFSSIFNEWQTTDEALNGVYRTFSETVRLPFPKRAIQLTLARRDRQMVFHELFSILIDPGLPTRVNKEKKEHPYMVTPLMENGAPSVKVDILIMGDGYAKADMEKFRKDAKHFNDVMFGTEPFKSRKQKFNVWTIEVESKKSGIDVPDKDVWKGNTLGTQYNTFGTPRYVLTTDNKTVRNIAAAAPYDYICILVNDERYGGGGIYNLYATTYSRETSHGHEWQMDYMYIHEFGHSFAGLGDEYYTSSTSYNDFYIPGVEPWEPNITALIDKKHVKWKEFLTPGVEIPTPWDKAPYDSIEGIRQKLDRLAPDYYEKRAPLLKGSMDIITSSKYAGKVGAFEGSGYASKGLYRPSADCRMFSLSLTGFDPVCEDAICRVIEFYAN
jgi:hypothetical protein